MVWQVKTLKDGMRFVLWINSIFCMGVFEIPANQPQYLLTFIYIALIMAGYLIVFYNTVMIYITVFKNEFITLYTMTMLMVLVAICSIVLFWCKFRNVDVIIKRCAIVDDTLEKFGFEKDYKNVFYTVLRTFTISILSMLILLTMQLSWTAIIFSPEYAVYIYITMCFPSSINMVVGVTLFSLVRYIKMKFRSMNDLMKNMIHSANETEICRVRNQRQNKLITITENSYKNNKERIKHLLQTLRQLHLEITRIARLVNDTYSTQILLESVIHFAVIVSAFYVLYLIFSGKSLYGKVPMRIISLIYWALMYSFKIIFINNLCSKTSSESLKIGAILQTIDSSLLDDELREEIQQFTQQIILNPLNFTAAGFFTLNNACTGKFFSTVTTYLVILIQFNAPTK